MTREAERAWRAAHDAWTADPNPDTERALNRAADTLRRARHGTHAAEGVTNADQRETFDDDDDENDDE